MRQDNLRRGDGEGVPLLHFHGPRYGSGGSSGPQQRHATKEGLIRTGANGLGRDLREQVYISPGAC